MMLYDGHNHPLCFYYNRFMQWMQVTLRCRYSSTVCTIFLCPVVFLSLWCCFQSFAEYNFLLKKSAGRSSHIDQLSVSIFSKTILLRMSKSEKGPEKVLFCQKIVSLEQKIFA